MGAIGLLGTGAALIIGRAVTLSFVFAVVGVALVAYCFVKLSQHISHTGSVYALVGVTLGPQAGFFAGWALMGAYIADRLRFDDRDRAVRPQVSSTTRSAPTSTHSGGGSR